MAKHQHLTKDRELELGVVIQKRYRALAELEAAMTTGENGEVTSSLSQDTIASLQNDITAGNSAIDEMVRANMGLVYDRARKFKSRFPGAGELQDLVSMGSMGLMVAIEKYNPERGNKFSTMAVHWIYQHISREVNKTARPVRLPENRISDYTKMNAVAAKYEKDGLAGSELDKKIMDELGLSKVELMNIRNAATGAASLNRTVGNASDGSSKELMDIVGEARAENGTEYTALNDECLSILKAEMEALDPMKAQIVASQFEIPFNGVYFTPQEVRETHELSSSKFRRLLNDSMSELRSRLQSQDLLLEDFIQG